MCAAVMGLLFGLWQYWTPVQLDDLWYQAFYRRFAGDGGGGGLAAWLDYAAWHRVDSNGRLANYLAPLATLVVPRWLFAALTGACVGCLLLLVTRLGAWGRAHDRVFSNRWTALVAGASLVFFPWRDCLMYHDYALNYLFSTVVDLLFMWGWLVALRRRLGWPVFLAACVAALVGGMMHEGLAVPMVAACGVVALARRMRLPWQAWVLAALFLLGTMECALAPGIMARASRDLGGDVWLNIWSTLESCSLFFVVVAVTCLGLWLPRRQKATRRLLVSPAFLMCVSNAAVGTVLCCMFFDTAPRFGWVSQVYSAVALGMIVRRSGMMRHRFAGSVALMAMVMGVMVLINTIRVEKRFYEEDSQIRSELGRSPHGTVYRDLERLDFLTKLATADLPGGQVWGSAFQIGGYNKLNPDREYAVVPSVLSEFRGDFDKSLPGDARVGRWRGLWLGHPVESDAFDRRAAMVGQVRLALSIDSGETCHIVADTWSFHTPDGCRWMYYSYYDWPEGVVAVNFVF